MVAADPVLLPLVKKFLNLSLMHPEVERWKRYILIVPLCLDMIFMCSMAIANTILVGGLDVLQESLETFSIYFQTLLKIIIYNYYFSSTRNLIRTVENKFWPLDSFDSELEKHLKKKLNFFYAGYKLYASFLLLNCVFVELRAIIIGKTPVTIYEFIDYGKVYNYLLVYSLQTFVTLFGALGVMGIDGSFISFVVLTCIQLKLLQGGFAQLKFGEVKTEAEEEQKYNKIKKYVDHHNLLLDFLNEVRRAYSFLLLTQFTTSALILCSATYMYMSDGITTVQSSRYIIIGSTIFCQLFIYSYIGQMITDTAFDFVLTAYGTNWYEQLHSSHIMSAVKMVIIRSQIPVVLKAGYLYDLNIENFSGILQLSYSFYTLFRTLQIDE